MFCKKSRRPAALLKKSLAQVFSCEICEISKKVFFHRATPVAASELVKKCCFKLFRILQIEYIIYIKNIKRCIASTLNISIVSSVVIFLTKIEYGTSSLSIDSNELFIWVFLHFIRGWLVRAGNAIGSSCSR